MVPVSAAQHEQHCTAHAAADHIKITTKRLAHLCRESCNTRRPRREVLPDLHKHYCSDFDNNALLSTYEGGHLVDAAKQTERHAAESFTLLHDRQSVQVSRVGCLSLGFGLEGETSPQLLVCLSMYDGTCLLCITFLLMSSAVIMQAFNANEMFKAPLDLDATSLDAAANLPAPKFAVLSVDGGGFKGIMPAAILVQLE